MSNVYMWRWGCYFQIVFNEYQHWTFPKNNYKRVVTLYVMKLDKSQREMISQEVFSCIILCDLCHNIYHKVVFRSDMFSPDYMWNSKVKIYVWTRLVKRDDLSVSTSQWSSHVSQCLRNNWVTRGGTLKSISQPKHLCTCTRLRQMARRQEGGTTWSNIENVVKTLNNPISDCITKIVADMHQAITNHQADLNMVMMVPQICYSH